MMPARIKCFSALLMALLWAAASKAQSPQNQEQIVFKDTLYDLFVFDSLEHNIGVIWPNSPRQSCEVVKYFKYLGDEIVIIYDAFTSDPHFLSEYPRGPLQTNKVYALRFCFAHSPNGKQRHTLRKTIGFELHNGKRVYFSFSGLYMPEGQDMEGKDVPASIQPDNTR